MLLCKYTKKLLSEAFSERLKKVQKYEISPFDLSMLQTAEENEEEILRKLMVVFRKNIDKYSDEIFSHLQLLALSAQKDDLRFIDVFHYYFEVLTSQKTCFRNLNTFLSIYAALLDYHLKLFQLEASNEEMLQNFGSL